MYGLLVRFGLMFDKGQKQSSTLSCDSSYSIWVSIKKILKFLHLRMDRAEIVKEYEMFIIFYTKMDIFTVIQ